MIVVPETYRYIEVYLTLRCNLACPYCINKHTGVVRKRNEIDGKSWAMALNRIRTTLPITLGGGEPTCHPGFYDIMDGLRNNVKIDLLTNGMFDVVEFCKRVKRRPFRRSKPEYKAIRVSYHPSQTGQDDIVSKVEYLNARGFGAGIFSINHPENLPYNIKMAEKCAKRKVYFFVRDFLGYYGDVLYGHYKYRAALNGNPKPCQCKTSELLIGPDGMVYRCHRDLYVRENPIGNVFNILYRVEDKFRPCEKYGLCSNCDIKQKLAPDLSAPRCSVEIIEQ